jgi:hypothetical protein
MSLFTSASRSPETKVVLSLLILLAVVESGFSLAGHLLSRDVTNIRSISATAQTMASAAAPRVLFVGNSITQAGVDPALLTEEAIKHGSPAQLSVHTAYPDSSHVTVWDYLTRRYFLEQGSLPEDIVIVTGQLHLLDAPVNHAHLGAYYVSTSDMLYYLKHDAGSIDHSVEFLLSRGLMTPSLRARVSPRLFDLVLPHYQENWTLLNQASMKGALASGSKAAAGGTTSHLERLIATLQQHHIRLTVVAAPMQQPYELHPRVIAALQKAKVNILDLRSVPGLGSDHFADADHLNAKGKELFTRALAPGLTSLWQP